MRVAALNRSFTVHRFLVNKFSSGYVHVIYSVLTLTMLYV